VIDHNGTSTNVQLPPEEESWIEKELLKSEIDFLSGTLRYPIEDYFNKLKERRAAGK
jgi:hypothetical protein